MADEPNQSNPTPVSSPEPSSIPSSPDTSLVSSQTQGLSGPTSIPSTSDLSLSSEFTMNEHGVNSIKGQEK